MNGTVRIVGAVLCCVFAFATSASAECAWVLWYGAGGASGWVAVSYWDTKKDYERARLAEGNTRLEGVRWMENASRESCLPDTVDPRGPKGTK